MTDEQYKDLRTILKDLLEQLTDLTDAVEDLQTPINALAESCDPDNMLEQMREALTLMNTDRLAAQKPRSNSYEYPDHTQP